MIKDGLYVVSFSSSDDHGTGVVVVKDGAVNGGDYAYTYQGHLVQQEGAVSSTLEVSRYNPTAQSIFGPVENFELELSGNVNGNRFDMTGNVKGQPSHTINVAARHFKDLA